MPDTVRAQGGSARTMLESEWKAIIGLLLAVGLIALVVGLVVRGYISASADYNKCLEAGRAEADRVGAQMDHEDYAVNKCTELDGETPDPNWRNNFDPAIQ